MLYHLIPLLTAFYNRNCLGGRGETSIPDLYHYGRPSVAFPFCLYSRKMKARRQEKGRHLVFWREEKPGRHRKSSKETSLARANGILVKAAEGKAPYICIMDLDSALPPSLLSSHFSPMPAVPLSTFSVLFEEGRK